MSVILPAFISPKGVWMEQRGLAPPIAWRPTPRVPVVPERVSVVPSLPQVEIPVFRLSRRPSRRAVQQLIGHLRGLEVLGVEQPEVEEELDRLAGVLRAWVDEVEDGMAVQEAAEALERREIAAAIMSLDLAFPTRPARLTPTARLEMEGRTFRTRIEALRVAPDLQELASLEEDMLDYFDRVLDAASGPVATSRPASWPSAAAF